MTPSNLESARTQMKFLKRTAFQPVRLRFNTAAGCLAIYPNSVSNRIFLVDIDSSEPVGNYIGLNPTTSYSLLHVVWGHRYVTGS
jgi:hypothetical protein